ncbi:MAG TPA: PA2169 family four-helix-bundle protein [Arenimonas sp.]|uniref:PA2169 family four-helix-bundle protein n=1 Tax=Arenimonas sp. TaxID=1872635 RepID=UPI002CDDA9D5|nr:PA2169 family four-helix-bundle protein [Arenimonas sp.]HMB57911.1 PA2169 family four-helix-bundle protein [Arenimonas sp.]
MNHNKHLNDLVAVARDGKDFYEYAATRVDDQELKSLFTRMAGIKGEIVQGLSSEIKATGDVPTQSGTIVGDMNKLYGSVRALLGNKDYAYVAQLEESEDRLLKAFNIAIADKDTTATALAVLNRLLLQVRQCHEQMRTRKLALKKAA